MGLFSRKKQILALDIGSYAIKYALLDNTGKDIVVRFAGQKAVPPQDVGVGELEGATVALKQLAVELDLVKKKLHQVVFALPSSLAIVRFVTLPPTPLDRVKAILRGEAEQHIPFSIDDVAMDTQILRADDKGVEAIIVAVKQEKVDEYVNLVQVAGLTPEVIDVSAFSLFNVFRFTEGEKLQALAKAPEDGGEAKEPVVALLDLGASTTDISVCQGGKLMLTRSVAISGNSLTDAVSRRLNVPPLLAERYKKAQGRARTEAAEPKEEKKTTTGTMGAPRAPMGEMAGPKISLGAPKAPGLAPGAAPSAPPPAPALTPAAPAAAAPVSPASAEETAPPMPAAPPVSTEGSMQPPPAAPAGLPTPQAPVAPSVSTEGGVKPPPAAPKPLAAPKPPAAPGLPTPQAPAAPAAPKPPAAPAAPAGLPTPQAPAAPAGLPTPQAPTAPKPPTAPAAPAPPAAKPETEGGLQIPSTPPPPPAGFRLGGPKPPAAAAPAPPAGVNKMLGSKLAGDQSATGGSGLRRPPAAPGGGLRVEKPAAPPPPPATPPSPPPPPAGGNSVGAAKAEAVPEEAAVDEATAPLENKAEDIESAIKPMLDRLVGELKRSFDYFKAQIINEDIGKIYLCGGGAQLKDLATFLQQKTGIETEVLNPLQKLSVDGVDLGVELGSVFGLGLRVVGYECAVQTNLLPADIAIRKRSLARQRNLSIMGVLGALLVAEIAFAGWWVYDMRVTERDDILAKLEELKEVVEKVKTLEATQARLTDRKNLIMRLSLERARWLDVLRELNNILAKVTETPGRKVWLQTLSYTSKEICSLSGMASDFNVVGELNQRFSESPFYEVEGFPTSSKDAASGMVQFNFTLRVTQAPDMEEMRRQLEQAAAGGEGAPAEGGA